MGAELRGVLDPGDVEQRVALVDGRYVGAADDDAGEARDHVRLAFAIRVGDDAYPLPGVDMIAAALPRADDAALLGADPAAGCRQPRRGPLAAPLPVHAQLPPTIQHAAYAGAYPPCAHPHVVWVERE